MLKIIYNRFRTIVSHFYSYYIKFNWILFKQKRILSQIKNKEEISVVFFAMNLAMWRYQFLVEAMIKNPLFKVNIVLSPCITFSKEQQLKDIKQLREYFSAHSTSYIDYDFNEQAIFDVRKVLDPDLVFYPQPYSFILCKEHDSTNFQDKLLCYYPYAFWTAYSPWSYNEFFHNIAWKLYYSTEFHKKDAIHFAHNKGKNVVVVGYPNADNFIYKPSTNVWKSQLKSKKRIIWAPHFTISKERSFVVHSSFLWMADFMLEIAQKYTEEIQIAFKPHPRLLTELYAHPDWGKEKADAYYRIWNEMPNGQLEDGEFKDLFMTSDGMIHDSSSFTVEYHYSLKPVMYIQKDLKSYADTLSEFGKIALEAHYIGKNEQDIIDFIENVILKEEDFMHPIRKQFYDRFLLPPNNLSVAENTLDDILRSLKKK